MSSAKTDCSRGKMTENSRKRGRERTKKSRKRGRKDYQGGKKNYPTK